MSKLQCTLQISALMGVLRNLLCQHGDVLVYLEDPHTGSLLGITVGYQPKEDDPEASGYIAIYAAYEKEE
jgi:hypothetical protein